jgi:hypothetical protein
MKRYSAAYRDHYKRGPFPGRVDPWAEAGRYFQQLHAALIGSLMDQLQDPLIEMGYSIGRETSLQVIEHRKPDMYVEQNSRQEVPDPIWHYAQAAQALLVEPGVVIEEQDFELERLQIGAIEGDDLVTIVEVVSPKNKETQSIVLDYVERRNHFVRDKQVHVVEVDLTRSLKRLVQDPLAGIYPYHIAVHLPHETSRLIGMDYGKALKPFALPLRNEAIVVNSQAAYDQAYQKASIAGHIEKETRYAEAELPFPSLLKESVRRADLDAAQQWRSELAQLAAES